MTGWMQALYPGMAVRWFWPSPKASGPEKMMISDESQRPGNPEDHQYISRWAKFREPGVLMSKGRETSRRKKRNSLSSVFSCSNQMISTNTEGRSSSDSHASVLWKHPHTQKQCLPSLPGTLIHSSGHLKSIITVCLHFYSAHCIFYIFYFSKLLPGMSSLSHGLFKCAIRFSSV